MMFSSLEFDLLIECTLVLLDVVSSFGIVCADVNWAVCARKFWIL